MSTIVQDTFTGTDATSLVSHTGETGATWTKSPASGTSTAVLQTNRLRNDATANNSLYYASGVPAAADYTVEADLYVASNLSTAQTAICGRLDTTAFTCYMFRYLGASLSWELSSVAAGTATVLGTQAASLTVGQSYHMKLAMSGTTITASVDGVTLFNVTNSAVSAVGRAGVRFSGAFGSTTGFHLDNFLTTDAGAVPTNSVAPVVSGTRVVGQTLTATTGTWTGSPTGYTYQWRNDNVAISGATSSTYVAQSTDAAHTVTCAVTATNATGSSTPAISNGLAVVAEMVASDVVFKKAAASGVGGSPGVTIVNPTDVWDSVSFAESTAGDIEYRAIYITNNHAVRSLTTGVIWIQTQTTSPTTDLSIGVAPEAAGSDVTAVANESTAPASVTFSAPSTSGTGLSLGAIGPGQSKGVWLKRNVIAGTVAIAIDACTLGWQGTPS